MLWIGGGEIGFANSDIGYNFTGYDVFYGYNQ